MNAKECADKLRWWAERFSPRSEQWAQPAAKDLRATAHIIEALIEERHYLGASAERANAERAKLESELFAVLHRALDLPDDADVLTMARDLVRERDQWKAAARRNVAQNEEMPTCNGCLGRCGNPLRDGLCGACWPKYPALRVPS